MSNSFVTAKLIAQRALPILKDQIKFLPLVNRRYDSTFRKAGDTIQVIKPARYSTADGSSTIASAYNDIDESAVEVELDTQRAVPFNLSSKELSLNADDLQRQVIMPAAVALAEKINDSLASLYVDIPYWVGTSGATPDGLDDLANINKMLNKNRAPRSERSFLMDWDAEAKFLQLETLAEVDKAGTNSALREAALGRVYGMLLAGDSDIQTHTAGGFAALDDVTITAGASGATSVELTSAGGVSTAKLLEGDVFSIDDYQFTVTADTDAASSGVVTVSIYPALPKAFGDFTSADVTFADVTAGAHEANLAFQRDAFCFATAPLAPAVGGADSYTVSYDGLSIRVVQDYDIDTDGNKWRMDVLYGVKTLYPELAVRVLG
ncbi:MAG: P22 coat protein [Clostridiales bacterium]|nr:P22 coat protein [Clostridiales bacterium]